MPIVIVGGQTREIGKTSLVCSIIAAFPERVWTAVKITGFGVDEAAKYGGTWAIEEERERGTGTDSSRFLAAGARRAFWLRVPVGRLGEAMPAFHTAVAGAQNVAIESNSILDFVRPDVYLMLLDPGRSDFKPSARKFLDRADAFVLGPSAPAGPPGKRTFRLGAGRSLTPALIDYLRTRLKEAA